MSSHLVSYHSPLPLSPPCGRSLGRPRLACAYVERPLLLDGRKFDCRLYVAVRSLSPPRLYLYRHWYARVCSAQYAGSALSDHLAHLTVQKYMGVLQEFVMQEELIARLTAAGKAGSGDSSCPFDWEKIVHPRLLSALADAFRLLVERAGTGAGKWGGGRCRALYGVDVLFACSKAWQQERRGQSFEPDGLASDDGAQPVVLEVNYSADYGKLLELHPIFLEDVFEKLFLEDEGEGRSSDGASPLWERLPM